MASIAVMVGGAVLNSVAFSGGNTLFSLVLTKNVNSAMTLKQNWQLPATSTLGKETKRLTGQTKNHASKTMPNKFLMISMPIWTNVTLDS